MNFNGCFRFLGFVIVSALLSTCLFSQDKTSDGSAGDTKVKMTLMTQEEVKEIPGAGKLLIYKTGFGYVISKDKEPVEKMAAMAEKTVAAFEKYFGRPASKGIVYFLDQETADGVFEINKVLKTAWQSPYLSAEYVMSSMMEELVSEIKKQLKQQIPGLQDAQLDAMIKQNLPGLRKQIETQTKDVGVSEHELGHFVFIGTYWGMSDDSEGDAVYGGPAADWLDETAAVLVEGETLTKQRWDTMIKMGKQDLEKLVPLADFFTAVRKVEQDSSDKPENTVEVRSGKEDDPEGFGVEYYAQCRSVADYLILVTGQQDIFGEITMNEVNGGDFASWLKKNGKENGLPDTVDELDKAYRKWLKAEIKLRSEK